MLGRIHIYCGDGKGKTTAATGLAVRAAGAGKRVVFTQFFKDGSSSEIKILSNVENIRLMHCKTVRGFWSRMDASQRKQAGEDYTKLFTDVMVAAKDCDVLILDEMISACNHGAVPEFQVADFLRTKPENLEVVLTGRNPSQVLLNFADYVTEMRKVKHPFDQGVMARKGIEF